MNAEGQKLRCRYTASGLHGGIKEFLKSMSDEEAVGVVSNLVRVQAVIGTGAAVREGVACIATPVNACLHIGFAGPGLHCCKILHRHVEVPIMQRLSSTLTTCLALAEGSCELQSWVLVPCPSSVKRAQPRNS